MSAATKVPVVAGTLALTGAVVALWRHPAVQDFIEKYLGTSASSTILKALIGAAALINLKHLPGFWHIRVLRGIIYQIYFQKRPIPPKHLFAPMITHSYNTPYDTDYNFHKSNSTYFADLDVSRAHYIGAVIKTGLARLNSGDQEGLPKSNIEAKGKYIVALGAVSCFFQRQIEPLQSFEIYTRVLTWDRKWLYTISHIVKKGAIKPDSYVLQPWKNSRKHQAAVKKEEQDLTKHIFATSIARYVFKKGRLTINPEIPLERSRLLPPRPAGIGFPPRDGEASANGTPAICTPATPAANGNTQTDVDEVSSRLADVAHTAQLADDSWTWDDMEKERLRGLELATHFDALNAGHGELRGGDVLGKYGDYW
ncbi:putative thioesterase atnL [Fulvia fulva]|uniref:Thioesterase atnL n=1 Tax=Passalora fulva TaxID=5499 RepID=A0A9Q8LB28_PASFU|nr:putative thioesterase atnL [Fulvia fulva]UJO14095.1 putative thioesterase atnL [Fulvia fulva]